MSDSGKPNVFMDDIDRLAESVFEEWTEERKADNVVEFDSLGKKRTTTGEGGEREELGARFDYLPFAGLFWAAKIAAYGAGKYSPWNWTGCDPQSDHSPLSHAIGHAAEANELEFGSEERKWALGKVVFNGMMQLWFEERVGNDPK